MALRSRGLPLVALAAVFALVACVALVLPALGRGASSSPELRPDLVQRVPSGLVTRSLGERHQLGFDSAVDNRGEGPLLVNGRREDSSGDMVAAQLIRRADGSIARAPGVGTIRYTRSQGHHHWHLLRFDVYELRRASDGALVRPDRKTGFCLGDRYDSGHRLPNKPPDPVLETNCRLYEPGARSVEMGISVGYGDDYRAYLEGQSLDVTGLPAGDYELAHRANEARRLRERRYDNNAASVRLRLSWPNGPSERPRAELLERCPGSARCAP